MVEQFRGYAHRVDIEADASAVWQALTQTEKLRQWCSPGARIDPRAGGSFRASVDRVSELEACIDVFEPARRLRLIYLPSPHHPTAEVTIVDDLILEANGPITIVRLLGSGIPSTREWDTHYMRQRIGWERAMARLKVLVESSRKRCAS